jgi:hypothetical protein
MPTDPSDDPSLINDLQFLEELDRLEEGGESAIAPAVHSRTTYGDAFEALESGLPLKTEAPEIPAHRREQAPTIDRYDAPAVQRPPAAARVSFITAALVIVACLTAGAAGAALVFHDRVTQITAARTATR